jgi:cell division protein FtsI/penicillin-binding protein 2
MMKQMRESFIKVITSRVFIVGIVVLGMFLFMLARLFSLQIVEGEKYQKDLKTSILRELSIPASRGNIYDKYGRPLATNDVAYTVKIDNSIKVDEKQKNAAYMELIRIIDKSGDKVIDELPISTTRPYSFTYDGNQQKEINWKKTLYTAKSSMSDEQKKQYYSNITAEQVIEYLKELFEIPKYLNDQDARKLVALRYSIYLQRYKQYQPIIISSNVSKKTVAVIEELNEKFPGVYVEAESLRVYPEKGLFSHILGYTRAMDDKEYAVYKEYEGYTHEDVVGKTGIEKAMEIELNGIDGQMYVEVDSLGRRISTIETKQPQSGKDVYLTLDRDLQEVAANALVDQLKKVLLIKLDPGSTKNTRITLKELFTSMVNADRFSIASILASEQGSYQYNVKQVILNAKDNFELKTDEDKEVAKQILCDAIKSGAISSKVMILIMHEQGLISGDNNFVTGVAVGALDPLSVIKQKISNNEITPQDTALDPCSGSVVVTDVNTGNVLAMVSYPTYDNNKLVNTFNYDYYKTQEDDPTNPLINRPLLERKAPGSTLKMVTALAGLETGAINTTETIWDYALYDKVGNPPAKCWIYPSSHGAVNVIHALEVSCNYFFYETAYRMGNMSSGNRLQGIQTLNEYMRKFGLNSPTGIEIGEYTSQIASPEYKQILVKNSNPDATTSQTRWTDGETIRAAIGQSYNNITAASMSKYVATLANGGTRYSSHLIDKVKNVDGSIYLEKQPVVEEKIELKQKNLDAVYQGMLAVTTGSKGTLKSVFKDFEIKVGAKSGTAQEFLSRPPHAYAVAFAPFDEPQMAISVLIPFGDSTINASAEVAKTVIASYMGLDSKSEIKTTNNILSK